MTSDEHRACGQPSLPRLVDRVQNLPFILNAIALGLATNWVFSKVFGQGLLDIGVLPAGAVAVGIFGVLLVTGLLPFVGMVASWPAQAIGGALRWCLRVLVGSPRRPSPLNAGWVPLREARQMALAERDRYWTSRVDSALAAYSRRAALVDRTELQAFVLLALLVMDLGCAPSIVRTLLQLVGASSGTGWLVALYMLLALLWCWDVSRKLSAAPLIYHPVLAKQIARERASRRPERARVG